MPQQKGCQCRTGCFWETSICLVESFPRTCSSTSAPSLRCRENECREMIVPLCGTKALDVHIYSYLYNTGTVCTSGMIRTYNAFVQTMDNNQSCQKTRINLSRCQEVDNRTLTCGPASVAPEGPPGRPPDGHRRQKKCDICGEDPRSTRHLQHFPFLRG